MKSADVLAFLEQLPGEVPGHMAVIWDGAPMQGGHVVKVSWQIGRSNGCIRNACRPMP
jgi:hypothetical protein